VIILLTACGENGDIVPPPENVSFANDIQPIFTVNCISLGCHIGPTPQQGMDLTSGESYAHIVGVASMELNSMLRINPQNPSTSYLFQKVSGTHLTVGGTGDRMPPPPRPALDDDEIELLRIWITEGAMNN